MENKVANLLPRIVALEERFDTRPGDVAEQRRRDDLIRYNTILSLFTPQCSFPISKLKAIEEQLRLSDRQELPLPTGHAQVSEDLLQPLEALQEAILNYQVRSQPQAWCPSQH